MVQVLLHRLFICADHHRPIVVLRDIEGGRCLSLWVSEAEWTTLCAHVQSKGSPGLAGHDLLVNLLRALGVAILLIRLQERDHGVIEGEAALSWAAGSRQIRCHAGEALVLALKLEVPVYVPRGLLESRGWAAEDADAHHVPGSVGWGHPGRYVM